MPKKATPLTDTHIRKAKPKDKPYSLSDGGGLELQIKPNGTKAWRFRYYRPDGRRNMMGLGSYPDVSLTAARKMATELRGQVAQGIDPAEQKKQQREALKAQALENSRKNNPRFAHVFEEWYAIHSKRWSDSNAERMYNRGKLHLVSAIGDIPIKSLTRDHFFTILEQLEAKGIAETRNRVKQMAQQIMDYAMAKGYRTDNPVASISNNAFSPPKPKPRAHTTDPATLQAILRAFEGYKGDASVRAALRVLPHLPLRAKELVGLSWEEVDLKARMIWLPGERMKKDRPYRCTISDAVYEILKEQHERFGELSPYVFPSPRTLARHIAPESLGNALRKMGFKNVQSVHGFRHTAATLLNEKGFDSNLVRVQLSHKLENAIEATYNRADYIKQRREMMEEWSRYLEALKQASPAELSKFIVNGLEGERDAPEDA